ncbi:hypothetical protein WAA20_01465 [Butyrivibrio fibrisolvens]|uniref:hypothetical protein n=1 Tax=Butyrivibrio fibrisolvens TaxID=831 RepID=UPI000932FEE1|nr:hypothetical protein [Butyrivibrio fibrisolvens]
MNSQDLNLIQRKIAGYPERLGKMQKRYGAVFAPNASEISSAIKGLNAYMLQLQVNKGSFLKLKEEIEGDAAKLEEIEKSLDRAELSESVRLSLVQVMHAKATASDYVNSIDAQLDVAAVAKEKLELAQKQKKTIDVINLLTMIQKGDGYRL